MNDLNLMALYDNCNLCPRHCGVNRNAGGTGVCGMTHNAIINLSMLHFGEEPPITGTNGSGAIFFEGCSLRCEFCQNYKVSRGISNAGRAVTSRELADVCLELQSKGAHNINLVTPMHFAPTVAEALRMVKDKELTIPVIVNTGGYEEVNTLKLLDGLVDVYLPDMKYMSSKISTECSKAPDYFKHCCDALDEMYRQVGSAVIDSNGLVQRGMIIRHLMLPSKLFDTKQILDYIHKKYGDNVYVSLMNQYTPMPCLTESSPSYLKRKVPAGHYESAVNYLAILEHYNAFIQEDDASGDAMIPNFNN